MVPGTTTGNPKSQALARAFDRAKAEKLVAYPNADGSWSCKSYTLVETGPSACDVQCSCIAGQRGLVCKHSVCVTFCRKHGVRPVRPVAPVPAFIAADRARVPAGADPLAEVFN